MLCLLETHRHLYNSALRERKEIYEAEGRTVKYVEQSANLKGARKENPYLAVANFSSCQRTLKRLERAFQGFFRRLKAGDKPGYPRFKGYGRFDSVEFTVGDGAKLTSDRKVRFQHVEDVKIKLHRPIEGEIKTISFRKQADGWFVIFFCKLADTEIPNSENPSVGIDLGLKSFFVTSDGEEIKPPKLYQKAQNKLRRLQRSVARKKKGGMNRRKAVKTLAKFHQHVSDQRKDFHHKTALDLVNRFGKIAYEDLNVKGMIRSLNLAKSTHDAGWSQFLQILQHKAECAGVEVAGVNPRHTTQTCSNCGMVRGVPMPGYLPKEKLTLRERVYNCLHCGFSKDRDWNAAINIKNRAFPETNMARMEPLEANQEGCLMDFPRSPTGESSLLP
jgi:putative transposase